MPIDVQLFDRKVGDISWPHFVIQSRAAMVVQEVQQSQRYEPKMRTLLERVLCSLAMMMGTAAVTEAQNIYEGCGSSKKCLGFEKGLDDVQTTCLASRVR